MTTDEEQPVTPKASAADLRKAMNSTTNRKQLREFRKRAGLSQAQLASLAGVGQQMVSRFETGERDLSPAALSRLVEVVTDILSGKKAAEQVGALRKMKLSSLVGGKVTEDAFKQSGLLSSLTGPLLTSEQEIRELRDIVKKQDELIKGWQKVAKDNERIVELLKAEGPGSAAWASVSLLEQVEKLTTENAALREWLNAEETAALSHDKAKELRERLSLQGMRKENAEEEES